MVCPFVLVIIGDFNFVGVVAFPMEADAPLVVDADAVLPESVAAQGFQAVARRDAEFFEVLCFVDDAKLVEGTALNLGGQLRNSLACENRGAPFVTKALYHANRITVICNPVKRESQKYVIQFRMVKFFS